MDIILLERVEKLGKLGDVVKVKSGYARNYLLPTGKALRASKNNIEKFETERGNRESRNAETKSQAEAKATIAEGLSITLVRAASEMGQLFGSVSAKDIASAISEEGHTIDKRQVIMDKALKTLGLFPVKVSLHAEVHLTVMVNIARSLEEARKQAKPKRAKTANGDSEDSAMPDSEVKASEAKSAKADNRANGKDESPAAATGESPDESKS